MVTQKSADLIYFAVEAWNHTKHFIFWYQVINAWHKSQTVSGMNGISYI